MKILIDGHMLENYEGGNERYTYNIWKSLKKINPQTSILKKNWLNNVIRLSFQIPWLVFSHKISLVHSNYIGPFINLCKLVIMVHDLSFKKYPQFYSLKDKFIFNYLLPISIKKADAIIVPSNFTKKEFIKYYPQYSDKAFFIYEGVDKAFYKENKIKTKKQFILTINSLNRKKNINPVIQAFSKLSKKNKKIYLIVVGSSFNIRKDLLDTPRIIFFNHVSDKRLRWLYNNCRMFISNSLYEGFDLPVIEALKCGAFVIASDIPVHREISGNKLIYVNPNNYLDLYNKLNYYLSRPYLIEKITNQTSKIADKYSWTKTAKETLKIYRKVLRK